MLQTWHVPAQPFLRSGTATLIVKKRGTEFAEARGNYATLANRGRLPCMWWADNPFRVVVGADRENSPATFCSPCPVVGGPIVRPRPEITSRGVCHLFNDERSYARYKDGQPESCWGSKPNTQGWGELAWDLTLPKAVANVESAHLEISDDHSAQARLHASRAGESVTVLVNGQQASHFTLNRPSGFHEFLHELGQQPLSSQGGQPIDVTSLIGKPSGPVRVTIRVGAYTKWDVSEVELRLVTRHLELSPLSQTLLGVVLGIIGEFIVRALLRV